MQFQVSAILLTLIRISFEMPVQLYPSPNLTAANEHDGGLYYYEGTTTAETERALDISQRQSDTDSAVTNYVLSMSTGQFVAITKSGRVQANTQRGIVLITSTGLLGQFN